MKNSFVLILFYFINLYNAEAQFMPDIPIEIEFFHPMGYKDSIIIGLSLNADDGYDEGLDVIDTSEMQNPLDVRIYDPVVQQQIGGSTEYNLKHSYLALPDVPRGSEFKWFKEFYIIVKSDDFNFNTGPGYQNDCESLRQGLGSTYLVANTKFHESYQFHNTEGWDYNGNYLIGNNVNFHANFDIFQDVVFNDECISINAGRFTQNAYLKLRIQLINWLLLHPVNIAAYENSIQIQFINNQLAIQNSLPVSGISVFDLNGRLLFKDQNNQANTYTQALSLGPSLQPYVFVLSNANEQIIFTQKIQSN